MVEVERTGAQALYKSVGFEVQSTRYDYYMPGKHAYAMELDLQER